MSRFSKSEDDIVTEAWMKDLNKYKMIEKKSKAAKIIAGASSYPTENNIKMAYGALVDFAYFLTAEEKTKAKTVLDNEREKIRALGMLIHGDPKDKKTQELFKKYSVYKKKVQQGRFHVTEFTNLPKIAFELQDIFIILNELAQHLGFGSAKPMKKKYGMKALLEKSGLDPEEIGD